MVGKSDSLNATFDKTNSYRLFSAPPKFYAARFEDPCTASEVRNSKVTYQDELPT